MHLKYDVPGLGIEPRTAACQARVLTTTLSHLVDISDTMSCLVAEASQLVKLVQRPDCDDRGLIRTAAVGRLRSDSPRVNV